MSLACLRSFFLPAFLASALVLCGALYLELGLGLLVCPLCQSQRLVLAAFSLLCLAGLIHRPRLRGERFYLWSCLALALSGGLLAARHVWLQGFFSHVDGPCVESMAYLTAQGTPGEWLHGLLIGSANCVPINWSFLDLSVPEWSLLGFLGLAVLVVSRLVNARRRNPSEAVGS